MWSRRWAFAAVPPAACAGFWALRLTFVLEGPWASAFLFFWETGWAGILYERTCGAMGRRVGRRIGWGGYIFLELVSRIDLSAAKGADLRMEFLEADSI